MAGRVTGRRCVPAEFHCCFSEWNSVDDRAWNEGKATGAAGRSAAACDRWAAEKVNNCSQGSGNRTDKPDTEPEQFGKPFFVARSDVRKEAVLPIPLPLHFH